MSVESNPAHLDETSKLKRRQFLKGGVAAAAGLTLLELASAATLDAQIGTKRFGMLIDASRCATGCDACVTGCNEEHGLHGFDSPLTDAQWIRKVTLRHRGTDRIVSMPVMCQHCDDPPCVDVCPTGASFKRADGLVLVDKHICIGCRYCIMACPYKARSFIHETLSDQVPDAPRGKGTVEGCTMCVHRVDSDASRPPACAKSCTEAGHDAILFGELTDPDSVIAQRLRDEPSRELRPDLALNAGVRYQGI